MPTCPRCGTPCEPEEKYCGKCGQKLLSALSKGKETLQALDVSEVRYKLGLIYYRRGDLSEAIEIWKRVLEDNPENLAVKLLVEKAQEEEKAERDSP
ncbi:MAG: tetratricopeptide repeat protein [Candidatus Latescibacterota bacterium]